MYLLKMERYVDGKLVHNELYAGASTVNILESPEDISHKLQEWINRTSIAAKAGLLEISTDALQMTIQNNVKVDVIKDIMDKDPKADGAVVVTFNAVLGPNLELIESYRLIKCINTNVQVEQNAHTYTNLHSKPTAESLEELLNNKLSYKNIKIGKQTIKVLLAEKPITEVQRKDLMKLDLNAVFEYGSDGSDSDTVFLNNLGYMPPKYTLFKSMVIADDDLVKLYTGGTDYVFVMSDNYTYTTPRPRRRI